MHSPVGESGPVPSVRTAVTRTLRLAAWGRAAVLLGLAAVAVLALANSRDELLAAVQGLGRVAAPWVAVAVALEALSYTAYAAGQRLLLRRAGAPDLGLGVLTTTAVVAQAASNCLPGGVAVTGLVSHRQFTRRGVPPLLAGWVLVLTSGLYLTALALMSLVAAELTGGTGPVPGLQATSLGLALVLLVAGVALGVLRRRWDLPTLEAALRSRLPGRRSLAAGPGWATQLTSYRIGAGWLGAAFAWMLVSWLTDAAVLVAAYRALGTTPPWTGLLLAYCAGQLVASLPVTPGGLGVVEGSLTLALVAFGGAQQSTLTAVLLYRLVSFWALTAAGSLGWLALRRLTGRVSGADEPPVPSTEVAR